MAKPPWQKQQEYRDREKNGRVQITIECDRGIKDLLDDMRLRHNVDTIDARLKDPKIQAFLKAIVDLNGVLITH